MTPLLNTASIDVKDASKCLKKPNESSNKYSRGVLGLVTGSNAYPGAAVLSTKSAAYSNIGMVRYAGPFRAQNLVLQAVPEAVVSDCLQGKVNAITVGSGIPDYEHCNDDSTKSQRDYILDLLKPYSAHSACSAQNQENTNLPPVCVDAGALDLLPKKVCEKVVLTPHALELSKLLKHYNLDFSSENIAKNPVEFAQKAANLTGATVLLKGSTTVVASAESLNLPIFTCTYGPSWLATAGSGDVLAGILGALLAQNNCELNQNANYALIAASAAVIHGLAANWAAKSYAKLDAKSYAKSVYNCENHENHENHENIEHPIVASNIIDALPYVLGSLINLD
ncbi:ADP/ATP-dependent (S)-NAD(P)H-hydrate dehydratase [Gardnerella piotii]|uniref:ADP-dependent (S)-NAD(P)H-hydrate dehydratase n=1 Tax=Gardnerella piotii TaxID=2792977 RepID=A0AAU8NMY6_9BIFI